MHTSCKSQKFHMRKGAKLNYPSQLPIPILHLVDPPPVYLKNNLEPT